MHTGGAVDKDVGAQPRTSAAYLGRRHTGADGRCLGVVIGRGGYGHQMGESNTIGATIPPRRNPAVRVGDY